MPRYIRDGIIYMDFRFKDQRHRPSTGMEATERNIKLADQWDSAIHREITLGTFRIDNHFPHYRPAGYHRIDGDTFKAAATAWLDSHKNSWAPWTYRKFKTDLESRAFPKIGNMKIADLTGKDLRLLRESIIGEGKLDGGKLSNRSVNRIMQPIKAIFNELALDGEIQINPAARLGKLKEKRIAEIDPFADEEIEAILKAIDPWYRETVDFGFEFGGRLEDIFGLKWATVNFVTSILSIREARTLGQDKEPKTEAAIRDVDITPGMLRALTKQKPKSYLAGSYVFVTETGKPIDGNNFRRLIWEPALRKAGVKYRYPYQMRHSFATKQISSGNDPLWITNQMGTSLEMLFKTYAVYFRRNRLSQCAQSTTLSTRKRTKSDS
jgi:integrase